MKQNDYHKCLEEMFGLRRFGIKLGLDVIKNILNQLGNPQKRFSSVHIAGTNGKGSIASALSTILVAAGYRVGLYTSPHLIRFNERICINNAQISDDAVLDAYQAVKTAHSGTREPTFFEYTTAMAFFEFEKSRVDWAIIETGMGGRLDATNILSPAVSLISNISLEHRFYLGDTIAQIAREKGGIIKQDTPVITGAKQKPAIRVLERIAYEKSAPFFRLGRHFRVRRNGHGGFSYSGLDHTWKGMKTGLIGNHQVENAAVILAACEILKRQKVPLEFDSIKSGLETYNWPGRLEILTSSPRIIIDGAHNLMAARLLARFLKQELSSRNITLIMGVLDDKPYRAMLKALLAPCRRIILTQPEIDRRLPAEKLYKTVKSMGRDAEVIPDVGAAVRYALETTPPDDAVCIAGSLYVVGEAKQALNALGIQG